ncbi:MAG: proline--tRNA ligase, partial [Desulfobulbaceae bacterium]|nr:proline--tRNA ligase [Desulfobulbaceae bacterium]
DEKITKAAETLYEDLKKESVETLLDDRDERPGIKFKDADLIGIPYRITVGRNFAEKDQDEIKKRADGESIDLPLDEAVSGLSKMIGDELKVHHRS